jgi:hypothetical protein
MQANRQDLLLCQVAQEEDIILPQAEVLTAQIRIGQLAVLHTIDHLEQIQVLDPPPLLEEVSQMVTAQEALLVGQTTTRQTTVLRADLVLELAIAHQVEVQVDPQVARAQEDPEEGGINSPFFLDNISENNHRFVTNPT